MKIMSFNTQHCKNYVTGEIDYDVMANAILQCGADVVGLNEMRQGELYPDYAKQTEILSQKTGLPHFFFAKAINLRHGEYGNGLLSRVPIAQAQVIPVPNPEKKTGTTHYETRCLLKATLQNGVTVLVIHFGVNPDEQKNAVQTVVQHLKDQNCILMGDFNVTPENPVLDPIRARMRDVASSVTAPLFSYPSDNPRGKIDYIFTSPDIEVVCAEMPPIVASDHLPHTAEIRLKHL